MYSCRDLMSVFKPIFISCMFFLYGKTTPSLVATIDLFFRSEVYCLGTFNSFLFNVSGLICQNDLLLFRLIVTFVSISTNNTI